MTKKSKKDGKKKKKKDKKAALYSAAVETAPLVATFASVEDLDVIPRNNAAGQLVADVTAQVPLNSNEVLDGDPRLTVKNLDSGLDLFDEPMEPDGPEWKKMDILAGILQPGTTYKFKVVAKYFIKAEVSSSLIRTL